VTTQSVPAKRLSLADRITDELRHAILSQEYQPGDRLAAEQLAERFSVSATPVRESFARLSGEGLVTLLPQRGVRVSEISLTDMEEIYELRLALEPLAVHRSVEAGTPEWAERLEQLFHQMNEAGGLDVGSLSPVEYTAYETIHVEFHRETISQCGSRWMARIIDMLLDNSRRFRQLSMTARTDHAALALEHAAILEACLAGDPEAATQRHCAHVQRTRDVIREWDANGHRRVGMLAPSPDDTP
jgi:GntR family carbon starvation induced transcriptional regulator